MKARFMTVVSRVAYLFNQLRQRSALVKPRAFYAELNGV